MALVKIKADLFTIWETPLTGGSDPDWKDNTWIINALRHLANEIEIEQPRIYSIGIKSDLQYKSQKLVLEILNK